MTLHSQELEQIERRETKDNSERYRICIFAFDSCEDAKDPDIFYRFCDKARNRCPLKKENEEIKMLIGANQ